jgi:hypothetical protein
MLFASAKKRESPLSGGLFAVLGLRRVRKRLQGLLALRLQLGSEWVAAAVTAG